ncbi:MAG TPA: PQQ-binding-like beta-propeller repeat protein, partial [Candidatus Nanoarchaeia archaeon]|nr:PQQ-binding-like beta-propeller repeat protein [Candidatus Nanoarchaeia archaeon]
SFGQVLAFNTINEDGTHPYLWSAYTVQYSNASLPAALNTTWAMYDAGSGNWICNIINVPAGGTTITGSDGSICKFIISGTGANERLLVWNTTQAIWWEGTQQQWQAGDYSAFGGGGYDGWLPQLGRSYDGINGYFYNVTIPTLTGSIFSVQDGVAVYGGTSGSNNGTGTIIQGTMWALNLNPAKGSIGSLLWNYTFTPPVNLAPQGFNGLDGIAIFGGLTGPTVYPNDGVFLFEQGQTADCWYCYNLTNGQLMWTSAKEGDQWSSFGLASVIYNGELYSYGVSFGYPGNVYAIDMKTGKTLWDYASGETSSVLGWQNTPIAIMGAAGGILYVAGTDTFPTNPYPQGINLYALNATTGEVIWQIPFYPPGTAQKIAIADGYLVGANTYDNQIYCFGKGQTATAVTAPSIGVTTATPITITGAVKDLSAGAQQQAVAANFPNGLPCVSDASMSQFMEAVYMQQPMPNNITGVPVTFSVLDSNNNTYAIGSTTTDASGTYGFTWTPPVPGSYTIYATFAGSNSYYSSSAETHIYASAQTSASPAPVSSPTQSISPAPAPGSAAPLATYIAIAAVIVIVVVIAAALILRRRK